MVDSPFEFPWESVSKILKQPFIIIAIWVLIPPLKKKTSNLAKSRNYSRDENFAQISHFCRGECGFLTEYPNAATFIIVKMDHLSLPLFDLWRGCAVFKAVNWQPDSALSLKLDNIASKIARAVSRSGESTLGFFLLMWVHFWC